MWKFKHHISQRSRSLRVSVLPDGTLKVTTPTRYSERQIEQFLEHHRGWIERQLARLQARKPLAPAGSVSVFGKTFQLKTEFSREHPIGIRLEGQQLIINTLTPDTNPESPAAKKQLDRFLKLTATHYLTQRTTDLAAVMKTSFTKLTLREQTTRWGSCSNRGSLNFNWRLVHFPTEIIDYVIIHELAHRTHMNHSRAFWNLVAQFDPEHSKHRGWLKRHGHSYHPW